MGKPYRSTSRRNKKLVGHDMLHEDESHICQDHAQHSSLSTDHNALSNSNTRTMEPLQQALEDKELEKIANLFLSNTSLSQKEVVVRHEAIMSGPLRSNQKKKKSTHKAMIIKDATPASVGDNILSSLPPSCAAKLRGKRKLSVSNQNLIKSCEPKRLNKINEDEILASSDTESNGHRDFFVDLEGGGHPSEESLSRQVLQRAAAFLTKLKPDDIGSLWNYRKVAQGMQNDKDVSKSKATSKHSLKGMSRESGEGLGKTDRRKPLASAKPYVSLGESRIVQNDDWIGSKVDTDSSSDPSLVSDTDSDIKARENDFAGDLEDEVNDKGTSLRSPRNQGRNGGRLFTEDDDMWSD